MIDLSNIVRNYSAHELSRRQLVALLHDLFPVEKREVNLAIIAFDSGVVQRIAQSKSISSMQLYHFTKTLIDEFGLQEQQALSSVEMWASAFGVPIDKGNIENTQIGDLKCSDVNLQLKTGTSNDTVIERNRLDYILSYFPNNTAVILRYRGSEKQNIVVPNIIKGKRIIGIGEDAFRGCTAITSITLSDGIEFVQNGAFSECEKLKNIVFPESIERIGSIQNDFKSKYWVSEYRYKNRGAFQYDFNIESVILPSKISEIKECTFLDCRSLKTIELPNEITVIDNNAFNGCERLNDIRIPNSVKKIGAYAISNCNNFKSIIIPEGVLNICYSAFVDCDKLNKVLIPRSVNEIGKDAFKKKNTPQESQVTLYCYPGSYGMEYAKKNNYHIQNANYFSL